MRIFSDTLSANQERHFLPPWANRGFENDEGLIAGSFALLILGPSPLTFLFEFGPGFTHGHIPKQSLESPTSFPGSLFSASIVVEKRPWLTLVTCLPESGRFTKCVLGDGWQCRPCRHCEEGNQHAIDFVAR